MTVIPLQFFGIGDISFTISLVTKIAQGNKVVWPVLPQFVEGLNRAYPQFTFIDYSNFHIDYDTKIQKEVNIKSYGDCVLLPIRWADSIQRVPYSSVMRAKYEMYGLDFREWYNDAMWVRDKKKERELRKKVGKGDIIVNRFFRSDSSGCAQIDIKGIEMSSIDGFSLFDWTGILLEAKEIHTVSTSIIYLLEMLPITAEIHLYLRKPDEHDFKNIEYILQRHKYVLHG